MITLLEANGVRNRHLIAKAPSSRPLTPGYLQRLNFHCCCCVFSLQGSLTDRQPTAGIHLIVARLFVTKNIGSQLAPICFHLTSAIAPPRRKRWRQQEMKMAAPAVGLSRTRPTRPSDGPHVITNAAQGATKGSERGVADTSGVESTSQPQLRHFPAVKFTPRLVILAAIVWNYGIFVSKRLSCPRHPCKARFWWAIIYSWT